jgi:hypothetical protein
MVDIAVETTLVLISRDHELRVPSSRRPQRVGLAPHAGASLARSSTTNCGSPKP